MLIINQDKTTIINFNNVISIDCLEDGSIKVYYTFECRADYAGEYIGMYYSQERAKEIINEIVQTYNSANVNAKREVQFSENGIISSLPGYGFVQNIIYQMPEK